MFFHPTEGVTVILEPNQQSDIFCQKHLPVWSLWRLSSWRQNSNIPSQTGARNWFFNHEVSLYGTNLHLWTTIPCCRPQPWISAPCAWVCPARHKCDECVAMGYVTKQFLLRGWHVVHQHHLGRFQCLSWGLFIAPPDLFGLTSQR